MDNTQLNTISTTSAPDNNVIELGLNFADLKGASGMLNSANNRLFIPIENYRKSPNKRKGKYLIIQDTEVR